ncbi:MAG TPA: four helix bundle protein [Candidatus Paceibacterota bacterium]
MLLKGKEAYKLWLSIYKDFPKVERSGIGHRADIYFVWVMELTFRASYLPAQPKVLALAQAISRLDVLKFLLQTCWEMKLIHTDRYTELLKKTEEVGRMLGGWKKGVESKLPQPKK